ncbi:thiol reductant ABC exporter subunit CydD [Paenibacillus sp. FSL W8-1187]|uniref:thiol reductant ABC exporter subunit CydD n=1 Tax=Paenibacillus sp. FSL W8-1187 TaxID=2975339 RepID=UPI0030D953D6
MDRNLLTYKGIHKALGLIGALAVLQTACIALAAAGLAEAVSSLFAGQPAKEQWRPALLFLLAFMGRHGCAALSARIAWRFAETTAAALRRAMLERLLRLGSRAAGDLGVGGWVTLALEGTGKFRAYLELILPRMAGMAATPALLLVCVLALDRLSAFILLVTLPILIVFLILIGMTARGQMDRQLATYRRLAGHFVDSLRGLETLFVLGRSRSHRRSIEDVSERYRAATMKTLRVAFLSSFALDFFTMLSVASVAVSLGVRLVNGQMELVTALTVLILAPEYFLPVRQVGADFHATLDGKEAGEAMRAVIEMPAPEARLLGMAAERTEAEGAEAEGGAFPPYRDPFAWGPHSRLRLEGVGVRHGDGPASLESVSLELRAGERVGIVGASGAGKSTLLGVLGGFLAPTEGSAVLESRRWSGLTADGWRSQISYIPQRPHLFGGTLGDNIRLYQPEATDEATAAAARAAGLGPLLRSLPLGLQEPIGEGGRQLSGGQRQRVALARALLGQRPIVLLDEPTAHLDIETEYELKPSMLPLFEGRLVVLATHRLHWMEQMDRIVVLDGGRIVESGTPEELMALRGAYYDLATAGWEESA